MKNDKLYCINSYLMFRYIINEEYQFSDKLCRPKVDTEFRRKIISNSKELYDHIKEVIKKETKSGKVALALSGGIDSAILAKFMPPGSTAYTFKCIVPGKKVVDETEKAKLVAKENRLNHKIIEITWEDVINAMPILMKRKGAPIHSIEAQIYKAALQAKSDGFEKLLFGENADIIYGGMDGLLKEDWLYGDFIDRYSYILPYKVIKEGNLILEPYKKYEKNGHINAHEFINEYFRKEALGTYINACETAGIKFLSPFATTKLGVPLDLNRIRNGDTKYIVREVYEMLYPGKEIPDKIPMPRPLDEWMSNWSGPKRKEFFLDCHMKLSGEKKWLLFSLESFLNLLEK